MADEQQQYAQDDQGFYQPNYVDNQDAVQGMYEPQSTGYDMSGAAAAGVGPEQFPQDQ